MQQPLALLTNNATIFLEHEVFVVVIATRKFKFLEMEKI